MQARRLAPLGPDGGFSLASFYFMELLVGDSK